MARYTPLKMSGRTGSGLSVEIEIYANTGSVRLVARVAQEAASQLRLKFCMYWRMPSRTESRTGSGLSVEIEIFPEGYFVLKRAYVAQEAASQLRLKFAEDDVAQGIGAQSHRKRPPNEG